MKVLICCEESGVLRSEFRDNGDDAWSNDLEAAEDESPYHLQMDCFDAIRQGGWELIILHPPCCYMANSGNRWYGEGTDGHHLRLEAIDWTMQLWRFAVASADRVALENPVSSIFTTMYTQGIAVQYIQPYQHGHPEMKKTGLALHNLPPLMDTDFIVPPEPGTQEYIDWQKVWYMSPGPERKKMRSRTFPGIAKAIVQQWGTYNGASLDSQLAG